jgi:chromosome partition protein MukE
VTDSTFQSLEAAIGDEHFPEVDLMLRRGRHIGRDDGTAYDYLVDA